MIAKLRAVTLLTFLLIFIVPINATAFDLFKTSCSSGTAGGGPVCQQKDKQNASTSNPIGGPDGIIHKVADIFALVAGVAAIIIIIYSGFVFATAGGAIGGQRAGDNPTRAKNARGALIGAVVGLVIVALAWTITTFVTNNLIHT